MATEEQKVNSGVTAADEDEYRDDARRHESRLSLAIIGCQPERAKGLAKSDSVPMALIYGRLRGLTETKILTDKQTGAVRDTWGLVGDIEALNLETGQIFHGSVLYLPSGFHEAFMTEMRVELARMPNAAEIEFALEFHARPDANPRGYSWTAFNRVGVKKNDPLASLRRQALAACKAPLALVGPSAAPSPAD